MTNAIIKRCARKQPLAPATRMTLPISQKSEAAVLSALTGKLPTLALAFEREEIGPNLGEMRRRPLKLVGALLAVSSVPKSKATEIAHTPAAVRSARTLLAGIVAETVRLQNNQSI